MNFLLSPIIQFLANPRIRSKYIHATNNLFNYNRKEEILKHVMGFVSFTKVPGDYLEFGVWKGGSLTSAYHMSNAIGGLNQMHFYAFDSFEGLPEKSGLDLKSNEFRKAEYVCSESDVIQNLGKAGVDLQRVTTVKGWYDQVLNADLKKRLPIKHAAIIYIDCDLYESTVPVLEFVTEYIVDGTVIIFDDWHCFKNRKDMGEQQAFKEWLIKNPHFLASPYKGFGWMGESFILNIV